MVLRFTSYLFISRRGVTFYKDFLKNVKELQDKVNQYIDQNLKKVITKSTGIPLSQRCGK